MPLLRLLSPRLVDIYGSYLPDFSSSFFYPLTIYSYPTRRHLLSFLSYFALFIACLNLIKTKRQFKRIFAVIIIWAALLAFAELTWRFAILQEGFAGRVSFIVGQKNHFAAFMAMGVPLGLAYFLTAYRNSQKAFFLSLSLLTCVAVFLSGSYAGIGGLIFALFIFALLLLKNKLIKIHWLAVIIFIFSLIVFFIANLEKLNNLFPFIMDKKFPGRFYPARDALRIIKDFPLFGVGGGNFQYIFPLYRTFYAGFYNYLLNDFLQLFIEKGILGVFFYFSFFILVIKEIFKKIKTRNSSSVKILSIGVLSGLAGVAAHSFFEFNFHIPAIEVKFWILLAVVYKYVNTHFSKRPLKNGPGDT